MYLITEPYYYLALYNLKHKYIPSE